ncbi:hypothetical protein B0H17DRAFT_1176436 [Mycena rosella]|uniref:Uncharacterized protein n=1 Tax=Mycena rosella TaxID=1033263 RepID=A0AAD7DWF7_MYCRO|nr:hypothetical protein B0H17DRAFT_1176436 [Mycena rosella]
MPPLWSGLHIPRLKIGGPVSKHIEAWLDRAGTCPISISLGLSSPISDRGLDYDSEVVKPITDASSRIHHLEITGWWRPPDFYHFWHSAQRSCRPSQPASSLGASLRFDNRVLGIGGGHRWCKNLVRCSLSITHSGRLLPRPASALPSLQSLSLILDEDIIFDKSSLLFFLGSIPRITQLQLVGYSQDMVDDIFLSHLTPTAEQPARHLCPLLSHLEATGSTHCTFSDDVILNFVQDLPSKEAAVLLLGEFLADAEYDGSTWFTDGSLLLGSAGGAAVQVVQE